MNLQSWIRTIAAVACVVSLALVGCDDAPGPQLPPRADAGPEGELVITSPVSGTVITAADDSDGDLSNGIQVSVTVAAGADDETPVQLNSGGMMPLIQTLMGGTASFDVTFPGDRNGEYTLIATLSPESGEPETASVTVTVQVADCAVTVFPQPRGAGCDLGADVDEDPNVPGLQTTLTAETNCNFVSFTVNNLPPVSVDVGDGQAQVQVTLAEGQNQITVVATDGVGASATVGPYPLNVRTTAPRLELSSLRENRPNNLLIADGETESGRVYWTLVGQANGVGDGQEVTITLEPELSNAPTQARVDDNGEFRVELALNQGAYYAGRIEVSGQDECGVLGTSSSYEVLLDAVVPSVEIESPEDGHLMTATEDVDPDRAGIQIPVTIRVEDLRPETIDYDIIVECAGVGGNPTFGSRSRGDGDAVTRFELLDDSPENDAVIVTFQQTETGEFICRAVIDGPTNPNQLREVVWRAFFEEPSLTVRSPNPLLGCVSGPNLDINAVGNALDGNDPNLTVSITPEGGMPGPAQELISLGSETYALSLGSEQIPDGRYTLSFQGQVLGEIPVVIEPANLEVTVDRNGPSLTFVSPAADGVLNDADPQTAGTQASVIVQVCDAGGQTVTLNTVPPLPGVPFEAQVPEGSDCHDITLGQVTVPLGEIQFSASVTDTCGVVADAQQLGSIPPGAIGARITNPESGDVNVNLDGDPARVGCQFDLEAIGQGMAPGAEFTVCTNVEQSAPTPECDGGFSALAGQCQVVGSTQNGSRVVCPVSLQNGVHEVSFVGVWGERVESGVVTLNVDCEAPTVQSLRVVEDGDADGCINAQERLNALGGGSEANMTIRVETEGVEDGRTLRILAENGASLGSGVVNANLTTVEVSLPEGTRTLRADGTDAVGNPLPAAGPGYEELAVQVDISAPTPSLVNVAESACLNAAADADNVSDGLQYAVQLATGRAPGDSVIARLFINGNEVAAVPSQADALTFPEQNLPEGAHALAATVTDACGNVGSVNGFAQAGGIDVWNQPLTTPFSVDTVPPELSIIGLVDGATLGAVDDVDGDSSNGFQVDFSAQQTVNAPVEDGLPISVTINGSPGVTQPSPVLSTGNPAQAINIRATLATGSQVIRLEATDACGNTGQSTPIQVNLNIPGCASTVTGFGNNPQVLGAADGVSNGSQLVATVGGIVELLDANCSGAPVQLLVDGDEVANGVVPPSGNVSFGNVVLAEGVRNVRLRVGPVAGNTLESANQTLEVDLSTPAVLVTQPADASAVLTDSNAGLAGQQVLVQVSVTENVVVTDRTATLRVDGAPVGGSVAIANTSPATVTIPDVTLAAGLRSLEVCVADQVGNTSCTQWQVNADPSAPNAVGDLAVTLVDPRRAEIQLDFIAPGDDGAGGGPVSGFAIRRADTPILDETAWQNAAASELILAPIVQPGDAESITISGPGPGPALADGLILNQTHHLAVRAMDEAGRMGPLSQVVADLEWGRVTESFPPNGGAWSDNAFFNNTSLVDGLGDVDQDGFDDVLVTAVQGPTQYVAAVSFGRPDGDPLSTINLSLPDAALVSPSFFATAGSSLGDINGDGIGDFGVMGVRPGFAGSALVLYFGCNGCDRAEIAAPDALILADDNRIFGFLGNAGNFNQRGVDPSAMNDIFLGGSLSAQASDRTAFVVAGRQNWPALPASLNVNDDPAQNPDGVTVLSIPDVRAGYAGAGVGDQNNDGVDELVFSAGNPSVVYRFTGAADAADFIEYDAQSANTVVIADVCSDDPDGFGEYIVGGVDLDGDGQNRSDFIVADGINRRIGVFDHQIQSIDCFGRSRSLYGNITDFAGDIDGDGSMDLMATHAGVEVDAHIFLNDGMGHFGDGALASPRGFHALLAAPVLPKLGVAGVGDFDGDGRDDVAAVVKQPGGGNIELVIYH